MVSQEKSAYNLTEKLLYMTNCSSLAAFKNVSFILVFGHLCLHLVCLGFSHLEFVAWLRFVNSTLSSNSIGCVYYSSNSFLPHSFSSSITPIIFISVCLTESHKSTRCFTFIFFFRLGIFDCLIFKFANSFFCWLKPVVRFI